LRLAVAVADTELQLVEFHTGGVNRD
jgi:hypothetical protein